MTEENKPPQIFQQPGQITYDEQSRDWQCQGLHLSLRSLQDETHEGVAIWKKKPTTQRERDCKRLVHNFPDLGAAFGILQELSAEDAGPAAEQPTEEETPMEEQSDSTDASSTSGSQSVKISRHESGPMVLPRHLFSRDDTMISKWSVPQNFLYEEIARSIPEIEKDVHQTAGDLRSSLGQSEEPDLKTVSQTLDALVGGIPRSENIQDDDVVLRDLLEGSSSSNTDIRDWLLARRLSIPYGLGLDNALPTDSSLATTYQFLVNHWVKSLADKIPSSIRLAKERIARHVALAIFLGGVVAGAEEKKPPEDKLGQPAQPTFTPAPSSQESPHFPPPLASNLQYPTLTSGRPDTESIPTRVQLTSTVPQPSGAAARIFSHLDSTANTPLPSAAESADALAGSAMDPERRARQRRLLDRQIVLDQQRERKRLKLEAQGRGLIASGGGVQAASQPLVGGFAVSAWGSSQPPQTTQSQSQQTQTSQGVRSEYDVKRSTERRQGQGLRIDDMTASQVLPGAFGGRQGLAVRRKDKGKRKAGF